MKQIISFKKDIPFNTKIGEITSISLEHNLKMVDQDLIAGEFLVSGDYKITDASINREPFSFNLPFDIALDTKYNIENAKIDIDDFYYEIEDDQIMKVNVDVLIDGIEILDDFIFEKEDDKVKDRIVEVKEVNDEPKEEVRNSEEAKEVKSEVQEEVRNNKEVKTLDRVDDVEDREIMDLFQEIETPPVDVSVGPNIINEEKIKSLFDAFDDSDETFTTYHVHIVRENDTIETITTKYNTTKEEISLYNKIDELKLGDKIIIPAVQNE
ncbi:MAG TPA: LysM peptidoglycan-binding domain-containing protein [Mollicutes bacterium]|nr:LysM peptidoglycan-binding domain-containing protein [Mollicutes bacterium]